MRKVDFLISFFGFDSILEVLVIMAESTVMIEGLGMLTIKLSDDNFVKWSYQFQSMLRGYDLFEFFNGEFVCLSKFVINT